MKTDVNKILHICKKKRIRALLASVYSLYVIFCSRNTAIWILHLRLRYITRCAGSDLGSRLCCCVAPPPREGRRCGFLFLFGTPCWVWAFALAVICAEMPFARVCGDLGVAFMHLRMKRPFSAFLWLLWGNAVVGGGRGLVCFVCGESYKRDCGPSLGVNEGYTLLRPIPICRAEVGPPTQKPLICAGANQGLEMGCYTVFTCDGGGLPGLPEPAGSAWPWSAPVRSGLPGCPGWWCPSRRRRRWRRHSRGRCPHSTSR